MSKSNREANPAHPAPTNPEGTYEHVQGQAYGDAPDGSYDRVQAQGFGRDGGPDAANAPDAPDADQRADPKQGPEGSDPSSSGDVPKGVQHGGDEPATG